MVDDLSEEEFLEFSFLVDLVTLQLENRMKGCACEDCNCDECDACNCDFEYDEGLPF